VNQDFTFQCIFNSLFNRFSYSKLNDINPLKAMQIAMSVVWNGDIVKVESIYQTRWIGHTQWNVRRILT